VRPATADDRANWIGALDALPGKLRRAVHGFTPERWDTPYRPEGWTVRQLVHHLADSHLNAYVRVKLALTEDHPTVKPYDEVAWANLEDTRSTPPEVSLALLDALHTRWCVLLRAMSETAFRRTYYHPENGRTVALDELLALYAWHSDHHLRHITALAERSGWT
jgi:hypothetical protein